MLVSVYIENFALIEKLSLELESGFNVLTGETGAGKSIIIDAINMILGERASTELIKTGSERAFVEAVFSLKDNPRLAKRLKNLGLEPESELIISRELSPGKSVARVNNRTIAQGVLRQISTLLFDIHGQHQHQSLLNVEEHINILDSFGGKEILSLRRKAFEEYNYLQKFLSEFNRLRSSADIREKEKDFLKFQIVEIDSANLQPGEMEALSSEQKILKNAAKLAAKGKQASASLDQLENFLRTAQASLKEMAELDSSLAQKSDELDNTFYSVEDTAEYIRDYQQQISVNSDRLNEVTERLDFIRSMKRKHFKLGTEPLGDIVALILEKKKQMEQQYADLLNFDQDTSKLENDIKHQREVLGKICMELSMKRLAVAKNIEKQIVKNLDDLNMQNSIFRVQLKQFEDKAEGVPVLSNWFKAFPTGIDQVEFLISANPGEPPKPLAKIASGGEVSRIMLALKSVLADADPIPCMVFDEIDTGIGGRTAKAVAEKLADLAKKRQIICVTHLPQIASLAKNHLVVEKHFDGMRTVVGIIKLKDPEDRKEEISRMLSGTSSAATMKHAEEILKT
ncbi:DNA repair protein RecN [Candidatus Margulisiibacteriota bacterium]